MEENFIRERITKLRIKKNVSEYKMSLDLGHSKSYVQSIVSGRTMPSMSEFLYICDYFEISPKDFFDTEMENPLLVQQAVFAMKQMNDEDLKLLISIIDRLNQSS